MFEIALYGVYFRSTSFKADVSVSVPAIGKGGIRVCRRVFYMRALAFNNYRDLVAGGASEVRYGLGIEASVEATSTNNDVQFNLGAVAAQVAAEGVNANFSIHALGTKEFVKAVGDRLPQPGSFDYVAQESLLSAVRSILPDSIDPPPGSGAAPSPQFVQIQSAIEKFPDTAQVVVFACEQLAFGQSYREAYSRARKRFGVQFDPRPLEFVFQSFGYSDLSVAAPADTQNAAFRWVHEVDDYVADFIKGGSK